MFFALCLSTPNQKKETVCRWIDCVWFVVVCMMSRDRVKLNNTMFVCIINYVVYVCFCKNAYNRFKHAQCSLYSAAHVVGGLLLLCVCVFVVVCVTNDKEGIIEQLKIRIHIYNRTHKTQTQKHRDNSLLFSHKKKTRSVSLRTFSRSIFPYPRSSLSTFICQICAPHEIVQ